MAEGITFFCLTVIIYIVNLFIHELGHAIAIFLSKGKITGFRIGKKINIFNLEMHLLIGASVRHIDDNLSKGKRIFIALAGSVFSLSVFLLSYSLILDTNIINLFLTPIMDFSELGVKEIKQLLIQSYLLVIICDMCNLIPWKLKGEVSDGMVIWNLRKQKYYK